MAGYENREIFGLPGLNVPVHAGQAYAWNPSIAGVKSEDTMLVGERGFEVLTATGNWPQYQVDLEGQRIERPAILER
jgi:antitoxin VapB